MNGGFDLDLDYSLERATNQNKNNSQSKSKDKSKISSDHGNNKGDDSHGLAIPRTHSTDAGNESDTTYNNDNPRLSIGSSNRNSKSNQQEHQHQHHKRMFSFHNPFQRMNIFQSSKKSNTGKSHGNLNTGLNTGPDQNSNVNKNVDTNANSIPKNKMRQKSKCLDREPAQSKSRSIALTSAQAKANSKSQKDRNAEQYGQMVPDDRLSFITANSSIIDINMNLSSENDTDVGYNQSSDDYGDYVFQKPPTRLGKQNQSYKASHRAQEKSSGSSRSLKTAQLLKTPSNTEGFKQKQEISLQNELAHDLKRTQTARKRKSNMDEDIDLGIEASFDTGSNAGFSSKFDAGNKTLIHQTSGFTDISSSGNNISMQSAIRKTESSEYKILPPNEGLLAPLPIVDIRAQTVEVESSKAGKGVHVTDLDEIREKFKNTKDPPGINSLFPEPTVSKRPSSRRVPSKRLSALPEYRGASASAASLSSHQMNTKKQDRDQAFEKLTGIAPAGPKGAGKEIRDTTIQSSDPNVNPSAQKRRDDKDVSRKNGFSLLRRNELKYVEPDSRHGWGVVFCAFIIHFFATSNSGLMYLYTKEHINTFSQDHTYDQTLGYTNRQILYTILGALFMCIGGIASSVISFRTSFSFSSFLGSIVMSGSLVISSFTSNRGFFYVIRNITFGFGLGLSFYPAYILPCHWFKKRVGLATGIALSGALLGIMALFPLFRYALDNLGTKSTLRIHGLLILSICTVASIGLKSHYLKNSTLKFFDFYLFYDTRFLVLGLVSLLTWFGQIALSLFISDLCYINGFSKSQESWAIILLYVGGLAGVLLFGFASDKIGALRIIGITLTLSGIFSSIFWSFARSFGTVITYFILVGLMNGGVAVSLPIVVQTLFGLVNIPGTLSILLYSSSFIVITIVPSLRVPPKLYGEYKNESIDLIIFGGCSMIIAGILCILLPKMQHDYVRRLFKKNRREQARQTFGDMA